MSDLHAPLLAYRTSSDPDHLGVLADALEEAEDPRHLRVRFYSMLLEVCANAPKASLPVLQQAWRIGGARKATSGWTLPTVYYRRHGYPPRKAGYGVGVLLTCAMLRQILTLARPEEQHGYEFRLAYKFLAARELHSMRLVHYPCMSDQLGSTTLHNAPALQSILWQLRKSYVSGGVYIQIFSRVWALSRWRYLRNPGDADWQTTDEWKTFFLGRRQPAPDDFSDVGGPVNYLMLYSWLYRMYEGWLELQRSVFRARFGLNVGNAWWQSHKSYLVKLTRQEQQPSA